MEFRRVLFRSVRVEPPRREVLVGERGLLELERDVEQRVLAGDGEALVSRLLDDLRPGVVALVDAVAEAMEQALALLHRLDERRYLVDRADLLENQDDGLVGGAVAGAGKGCRCRPGGAEGVGAGR